MELIRISENKIKIMLNASDMSAYDLPNEGLDYCDFAVRDSFRAVLKDAGRKTGVDFSDGRLSIQLYPSKSGGCEMFVTRNPSDEEITQSGKSRQITSPSEKIEAVGSASKKSGIDRKNTDEKKPSWERSEAYAFESMQWLLSVCKRLKQIGFSGKSAAFRDESGRCFLLVESPGSIRPLIIEYGTAESAEAVRLYISEHGNTLCTRRAVEILGEF